MSRSTTLDASRAVWRAGAAILCALQLALTTGCGGASSEPSQPTTLSLSLLPVKATYFVRDTVRVRATLGSTGTAPTASVTWQSLTPSVATIDASGLVTGVAVGNATIRATAGGATGEIGVAIRGTEHRTRLDTSEVWRASESPHVVYGELRVGGPRHPVLTIEPGAEVRFRPGSLLAVSDTLDASGKRSALVIPAGGAPVRFVGDSPGTGTWIGVILEGAARAELRQLQVEGCGGSSSLNEGPRDCIVAVPNSFNEGPELLVDGLTITGARGVGLVLGRYVTFAPGSRNLTIENGQSFPLSAPPDVVGRLPTGVTYRGNAVQELRIVSGIVADSATWGDAGLPWRLTAPVFVHGARAPALTIAPGVRLRMDSVAALIVGSNGRGQLHVGSTSGAPVVIEPSSGSARWLGIAVNGGGDSSTFGNVTLDGCITCLLVEASGVLPTRVFLDSVTIRRAADVAVQLVARGRIGAGSRRVTITQSGRLPWRVAPDAAASIPAGTYTGNATDVVELSQRELYETASWRDVGIPFRARLGLALGDLAHAPVLTLAQGVRLYVGADERVVVNNGALRALGTASNPVRLTAIPGASGRTWIGVEFSASATFPTRLEYVEIDDAGLADSGVGGAVRLHDDLGGSLRHVTIRRSPTCGILLFSTLPWGEDYTDPAFGNVFVDVAGGSRCRFP